MKRIVRIGKGVKVRRAKAKEICDLSLSDGSESIGLCAESEGSARGEGYMVKDLRAE